MKKFIVFNETTHTLYYRFAELTSASESEEELQAEAIARAYAFTSAINYEHYNKDIIKLYKATIFVRYSECGNLIVYRSVSVYHPRTKEFRPNLDKFVYYIANKFFYLKTYLYLDGDTPCHNEPTSK